MSFLALGYNEVPSRNTSVSALFIDRALSLSSVLELLPVHSAQWKETRVSELTKALHRYLPSQMYHIQIFPPIRSSVGNKLGDWLRVPNSTFAYPGLV